jgi:hypothetical protein
MSSSGDFQADTLTQQDVVDILKEGTYPYKGNTIPFFIQKQKFPIYPSVEVRRVGSPSTTSDVQKTKIDTTFEIRLLLKYTRDEEFEEADRLVTEDEILKLLEDANIPPPNKIFFEQKNWNTAIVDQAIYGSESKLRFVFQEVISSTGDGFVGADNEFELDSLGQGSPLTGPLVAQVLSINDTSGATVDSHSVDDGRTQYDPRELKEGELRITYENTADLEALVKQLTEDRTEFEGKFVRAGVVQQVLLLLGNTTRSSKYTEIESATTDFYVVGFWT